MNIKNTTTISLNLELPVSNTPNIEEAFQYYFQEHPEIITQILTYRKPEPANKTWASVAQKFRENAMNKEAGEAMETARKELRETFAIGD